MCWICPEIPPRDVQFGTHRNTRLTDLTIVFAKTGIHRSARSAHFGFQHVGQFEEHLEVLLGTHSVTAGHDDGRSFDVDLRFFHVAFDHLDHEVRIGDVFLDVVAFDLALVALGEHLFLHHAFADGSHLRAVFRVDDRSDDVAAEGRTDLVEKILVRLADFLVLVVADLQCGAVGRQTALEGRGIRAGPRSRPITVAPIRQIWGFSSLNRLTRAEVWGSEV